MTIAKLHSDDALMLIDVQNDFCPGGRLAVPEGDAVVPVLNEWLAAARACGSTIVVTRDWHPSDHKSFQENGGPWPAHCVQGSRGAGFHAGLDLRDDHMLVSKGDRPDWDEYSDFADTTLAQDLRERGIARLWIGGLALDVCVRATVLDALALGFETRVIVAGTRSLGEESGRSALEEMRAAGAILEE